MKHLMAAFLLCLSLSTQAQKKQYLSFGLTDNASAYPFSTFFGFTSQPLHAGFEFGWGHERLKKKHSWIWELKAGYFHHQFVQHGIPIYATYAYRYLFTRHWSADASLGIGYLHSIPATDVYKLDPNGNYVNGKGIGRPQIMVPFTLGVNYAFRAGNGHDARVFFQYQQRLQAEFVKNYVPLLPYNQICIGGAYSFIPHKKNKL
jgi:hypothetical protein